MASARLKAEVAALRVAVTSVRMELTLLVRQMRVAISRDDAIKRVNTILRQLPTTLGQVPSHVRLCTPDFSHPNAIAPGWYRGGGNAEGDVRRPPIAWLSYCDGTREYVWQTGQTLDDIRAGLIAQLAAPEHDERPSLQTEVGDQPAIAEGA